METINLKAFPREILGKKVKVLRAEGQIPAILYGKNFPNQILLLNKSEFEKTFAVAPDRLDGRRARSGNRAAH
jgi:ribosomal protein L25 (general stress protein Ctc)